MISKMINNSKELIRAKVNLMAETKDLTDIGIEELYPIIAAAMNEVVNDLEPDVVIYGNDEGIFMKAQSEDESVTFKILVDRIRTKELDDIFGLVYIPENVATELDPDIECIYTSMRDMLDDVDVFVEIRNDGLIYTTQEEDLFITFKISIEFNGIGLEEWMNIVDLL